MKCATCQEEGTVHIKVIGVHLCESCLKKIDQRFKECYAAKPCNTCNGLGAVNPRQMSASELPDCMPCPTCAVDIYELAAIGASWNRDSSLEKWFPVTAEELAKFKELNQDKAKTIEAYRHMASWDKWKILRLLEAIDEYLSADGYRDASKILTNARADVVNSRCPIMWNEGNKVVQDHRDGTIIQPDTDIERSRRGLPVPWTPDIDATTPP